jgi:hypothetical protein
MWCICRRWWKCWSETLWAILIRSWLCSLLCYLFRLLLWRFLCNFIDANMSTEGNIHEGEID